MRGPENGASDEASVFDNDVVDIVDFDDAEIACDEESGIDGSNG